MKKRSIWFLGIFTAGLALAEAPTDISPPPPLWDLKSEATFLWTTGNTSVTTLGLGLETNYRPDPWAYRLRGAFLTSTNTGTQSAERLDVVGRAERSLTPSIGVYLQSAYFKNRFAGFNDRMGVEVGGLFGLLPPGKQSLGAEVGVGFIRENRTTLPSQDFASGRVGLKYECDLKEDLKFTAGLSFLSNFMNLADWRLNNTEALTMEINKVFALRVAFGLDFLNVPVAAQKLDTSTTVSLVATL